MTVLRSLLICCALLLVLPPSAHHAQTSRRRASAEPILIACAQPLDEGASLWLVGSVDRTRGYQDADVAYKRLRKLASSAGSRNRFVLADMDGYSTTRTAKAFQAEQNGPQGYYAQSVGSGARARGTSSSLAIGGATAPSDNKLVPRRPRRQIAQNPTYVAAVRTMLSQNKTVRDAGIRTTNPRIEQHYRVDLNGDGEEEVLLAGAARAGYRYGEPREGDYTFAAIRFYDGKVVKILPLSIEAFKRPANGEGITFAAPGEYRLAACADINGDGRMEIAVYSVAHESEVMEIFAFDGRRVQKVLTGAVGL